MARRGAIATTIAQEWHNVGADIVSLEAVTAAATARR
jgi:hypothetical protein